MVYTFMEGREGGRMREGGREGRREEGERKKVREEGEKPLSIFPYETSHG